jgi:putative IMPACT (imprinted ancient) family translation regulator
VFLAELRPAAGADERETALFAMRRRYHDATHHCSAWRAGLPVAEAGHDDGGEPAGTAGPPMLKALEGHGLTDVIVVCVRWYGGVKLGTGGLARAYAQGAQGAVAEAERRGLFEQVRIMVEGTIEAPPEMAHLPFAVLDSFRGAEVLGQEFGPRLSKTTFRLPPEDRQALESAWRDRSRGGDVKWARNGRFG